MNNELDSISIELSPDNILGYLISTKGYEEQEDDKRKKPTFYWKAYHLYPFVVTDEEYDPEDEEADPSLAICVEGGNKDVYNFVPMSSSDLRKFVREHPAFRVVDAQELFSEYSIV